MTDEQTPAAGPLTAESVKALTPWTSHNPRYGGNFKPVADDVWVQVKGNAAEPDGPARRAGDVYWGDQADCDNPVRWYREVPSPASSSSVVQGDASGVERVVGTIAHVSNGRSELPELIAAALRPQPSGETRAVGVRVMKRNGLDHATTPGHPDAFLNVLLDYTAGFYGTAREAGIPASKVADAMHHVESAARGLHALALIRPAPVASGGQPEQGGGMEVVAEWVSMARATPPSFGRVLRYVAISESELNALERLVSAEPAEARVRELEADLAVVRADKNILLECSARNADRATAAEAQLAKTKEGLPDLSSVIAWLDNGCDPKHAADELRIYKARIDAALQQAGEVG